MATTVDNPFFARMWTAMSAREPESVRRLRRENLAGLAGRVLEVGAGTGTNFAFYPATVTEVVAVEPERRLAVIAEHAAALAPVPVTLTADTVEGFQAGGQFDAVVCSLVLCSVEDPGEVVTHLFSLLKPGARCATWSMSPVPEPGPVCRRSRTRRSGRGWRATATPTATPKRPSPGRVPSGRGAPGVDDAPLGAAASRRVRDRPGRQTRIVSESLADQRGQALQQPGQCGARLLTQ